MKRQAGRSKYFGVTWCTALNSWKASLTLKGKKSIYLGSYAKNKEIDAARAVNWKCEDLGIPHKNLGVGILKPPVIKYRVKHHDKETKSLLRKKAQKTRTGLRKKSLDAIKKSKYIGVSWCRVRNIWKVYVGHNNGSIYGGAYEDDKVAAAVVNWKCDELGIPHKNPGMGTKRPHPIQGRGRTKLSSKSPQKRKPEPPTNNQGRRRLREHKPRRLRPQKKRKIELKSEYKGVVWDPNRQRWKACVTHDGVSHALGFFPRVDEQAAGETVNWKCDELKIARLNPELLARDRGPARKVKQIGQKKSKYIGVQWFEDRQKWVVIRKLNGEFMEVGEFNGEVAAAIESDDFARRHGIPGRRNFTNEFVVEKIVGRRQGECLVKWLHCEDSQNTWEPENNVKHLKEYKDFVKQEKPKLVVTRHPDPMRCPKGHVLVYKTALPKSEGYEFGVNCDRCAIKMARKEIPKLGIYTCVKCAESGFEYDCCTQCIAPPKSVKDPDVPLAVQAPALERIFSPRMPMPPLSPPPQVAQPPKPVLNANPPPQILNFPSLLQSNIPEFHEKPVASSPVKKEREIVNLALIDTSPFETWNISQVQSWWKQTLSKGLQPHYNLIEDEDLTGDILADITLEELQFFGLQITRAKVLLKHIRKARGIEIMDVKSS